MPPLTLATDGPRARLPATPPEAAAGRVAAALATAAGRLEFTSPELRDVVAALGAAFAAERWSAAALLETRDHAIHDALDRAGVEGAALGQVVLIHRWRVARRAYETPPRRAPRVPVPAPPSTAAWRPRRVASAPCTRAGTDSRAGRPPRS